MMSYHNLNIIILNAAYLCRGNIIFCSSRILGEIYLEIRRATQVQQQGRVNVEIGRGTGQFMVVVYINNVFQICTTHSMTEVASNHQVIMSSFYTENACNIRIKYFTTSKTLTNRYVIRIVVHDLANRYIPRYVPHNMQ